MWLTKSFFFPSQAYKLYDLFISDGSPSYINLLSNLDARDVVTWHPDVPSVLLSCLCLEPDRLWDNWPATMALLGDIDRGQYKEGDIQMTVKFSGSIENPLVSAVEIASCDGTYRSRLGRYPHGECGFTRTSAIRYGEGERITGLTVFRNTRQLLAAFIVSTSFVSMYIYVITN